MATVQGQGIPAQDRVLCLLVAEIFFLQLIHLLLVASLRGSAVQMLLHRDAFTHAEMRFTYLYIQISNTFTERWFYIEQNYSQMPKQREALLQRNAFARGAFTYGHFCTDILLPDFWRRTCIWRKRVQPAYAKSRFHRSFLTFETHFVGKGWPSTNPHCNLTSMRDDRHVVREGCVSWTSIHAARALYEKI